MASYKELLAQREKLDATIAAVREKEKAEVLQQIREHIKFYGFTPMQLFPLEDPSQQAVEKVVPAKYYDPDTGKSWSGRGRMPTWLKGRDLKQFEIQRDDEETPAKEPAAPAVQLSLENVRPLSAVELAERRHPLPSDAPKLEPRSLGPARRAPAPQPATPAKLDWSQVAPAPVKRSEPLARPPYSGPRSDKHKPRDKRNEKPQRDPDLVNPFPIQ